MTGPVPVDNDAAKSQLADLVDLVRGGFTELAQAQQDRARLTASAHAGGRRVTVTVNADGVVIETTFADDIGELSFTEIAAAVTAAAQQAAERVRVAAAAIMAGVTRRQEQIPGFDELFPGTPDFIAMIPQPPVVSTAAPGSRERAAPDADAMVFTDVEEVDHDRGPQSLVAEDQW
ncbi:YbaB/EbfC family nucleoid-associated protein [Nocardia aurantia]|uniref:YbaB/EbfC family DNA-binding protein n=1 Tax=Nocardia aurantia TaxID=2585199 RepID=A0A7K0DQ68_9NOCA|nr:YbaB/EbfC family nucleoid-associated protein [Nocardia aurantia]MQY27915.1 hypothetical protein [Nocardia aurantia]